MRNNAVYRMMLALQSIIAIESFCLKLEMDSKSANASTLFERLRNYISSELGEPVTPVKIEHIFRVNY